MRPGFCHGKREALASTMYSLMAAGTERNQVLFGIAAGAASKLNVVYLQVLHSAADLAAPAIALQDPPL